MLKTEEEYISNLSPYINLWSSVMDQAIWDLKHGEKQEKEEARQWIESDSTEFNSFRRLCAILNIDPVRARKNILRTKTYSRRRLPKRTCIICGKSYSKNMRRFEDDLYVCCKCRKKVK